MENLQPNESLKIIETIINERKQKYEQNGLVFIFWGILIPISSIINFFTESPKIWAILIPLGFILTFAYAFTIKRNTKQKNL